MSEIFRTFAQNFLKMEVEQIIEYMRIKPYTLKMGAGLLSKRLNASIADVKQAKHTIKSSRGERNITLTVPKILLFDLEVSPMKAYVWERWRQNISLDQTISENFIIAWSAKWLYDSKIMGDVLTPEEIIHEDDFRIVKNLWELINEADIVIAHNAKHADIPWMNSRFIMHNMIPPKPYLVVDTLEVSRKQFGFSSNKLDALAGYFNIPHKLETGFQLWKSCMEGDEQSLKYMLEYNNRDVLILEEVYLKLLPWIKSHPNISMLVQKDCCSHCGSDEYELLEGQYYYTSVGKYQLYRCKHCGTVFRARLSDKEFRPVNTGLR